MAPADVVTNCGVMPTGFPSRNAPNGCISMEDSATARCYSTSCVLTSNSTRIRSDVSAGADSCLASCSLCREPDDADRNTFVFGNLNHVLRSFGFSVPRYEKSISMRKHLAISDISSLLTKHIPFCGEAHNVYPAFFRIPLSERIRALGRSADNGCRLPIGKEIVAALFEQLIVGEGPRTGDDYAKGRIHATTPPLFFSDGSFYHYSLQFHVSQPCHEQKSGVDYG